MVLVNKNLKQGTVKLSTAPVRLGLREWRLDKHQRQRQLIETTFSLLPLCYLYLICLGSDKCSKAIGCLSARSWGSSPHVTLCVESASVWAIHAAAEGIYNRELQTQIPLKSEQTEPLAWLQPAAFKDKKMTHHPNSRSSCWVISCWWAAAIKGTKTIYSRTIFQTSRFINTQVRTTWGREHVLRGGYKLLKAPLPWVLIPFQSILLVKVTPGTKNRIARALWPNP